MQILPTKMTSLPIPRPPSEDAIAAPGCWTQLNIGNASAEDEQFLLRAFRSFSEAAGSLERSYAQLRTEVQTLRLELEDRNRKLAESLEENCAMRAHLDCILEGLPCGVLVVSPDGRISRMNPEAFRLLEEQQNLDEPDKIVALSPAVASLLTSARMQGSEQEARISGRGAVRWVAARYAPLADQAAVYILRDISERKRLEETESRTRRDQALAEMCAMLAHEIRNPLASLELFAGLLAESPQKDCCRQWIGHVQSGLRTLSATVNNVLRFHSQPEPEMTGVDLGELLRWTRDFLAPLAFQSDITLSLQESPVGICFAADRHGLEQVLLNLVLNSIRAMPSGGWIELAGRKVSSGAAVEVMVTDNGPGIGAEDLASVFEPGFTTRRGHSGLGLAVCHKIVEQHGGAIAVESSPERGTRFRVTVPLALHRERRNS